MLTGEDATPYNKVVSEVLKVFAEVLVDADWVLKRPEGQLTAILCPGFSCGNVD